MHIRKWFKYAYIICILLGLISIFCCWFQNTKDIEKQTHMISKSITREGTYTKIPYLEIPNLEIKRIIKENTETETLKQKYVGIWNSEKRIDRVHHLVLAGHNIQNVFAKLHKIKIGDRIDVHYKNHIYMYEVTLQKTIDVTNLPYLEETNDYQISLITCTGDDQKRLVVTGKRIKIK